MELIIYEMDFVCYTKEGKKFVIKAYKNNLAPLIDPNNPDASFPSVFDYLKRRDVKISYLEDNRREINIFLKLQFCEKDANDDVAPVENAGAKDV